MKIKQVTIQNFLSFGTAQTIDLDARGLVAVFGLNRDSAAADSNGAGKSTIMESIVWALFGETMRGYKADAVVNLTVGKDCFVELVAEDEGNTYRIRRTRKAASKRGNDLILTVNGVEVTAGVNADTQALVQTIVGMDFNTFTQSVMLSHGTRPFSQMTDKEQKEVLEDILQIDQISRAREVVSARMAAKMNDRSTVSAKVLGIKDYIADNEQMRDKLTVQHGQYAALQATKRKGLQRQKVEVEAKIEEIYQATELDKLLVLQEELQAQGATLAEERNQIHASRLNITRDFAAKKATIQRDQAQLQGQINGVGRQVGQINDLVGKQCPSCFQTLPMDVAEQLVAGWETVTAGNREEVAKLDKKLHRVNSQEVTALNQLADQDRTLSVRWNELQQHLRTTTEAIHKRQATLQLICQLEQQAWNIQQEIDGLDSQANPYGSLIDEKEKMLVELEKESRVLQYRQRSLDIELSHLSWWHQGFGNQGLKSYLLDSVIPFLNERAQSYADVLSGGDLKVEFSTRTQLKSGEWREQFRVMVTNAQGADVYQGNSDGEKRRIDIAVGWALGDLAASRAKKGIRFKGLDEPFENLDETGEDSVIKLLHKVLPEYETILCITHSTHLRDQFPSELVVVKENGMSTVQA